MSYDIPPSKMPAFDIAINKNKKDNVIFII